MIPKKTLALTSATGLALFGIVLVLLNVLSNWIFVRWDMTQHHTYSLSPSSKNLVRHLDDPVIIKAFFTPDLPPPYNAYGRYVKDMLAEYRAASKGKVRFEFELTQPAKDFEQRAQEANLLPIQFEEVGNDQLQIRRGFMGLVMYYRDHSEVLPVVKNIQGLEYDITSRIARMAQAHKKKILVTTGHGEPNWHSEQFKLAQDLALLYDLQDFALPQASTASLNADALLIAGPRTKFDEKSLWAIDQAIMRGIPAIFLIDTKNVMISQFRIAPLDSGLNDMLSSYGVKLGDRLICDAQCQTVGMTQNVGGFSFTSSVRYPFVPLVAQFDHDQPLTQGLETVAFPFPVSLEPTNNAVRFTPLFQSSSQSWLAPADAYSIAPTQVPQPGMNNTPGPFIMGATLHGSFKSYFTGKPTPVPGQALIGNSPASDLIVIGTSHHLDPNLPEFPGTEALISNIFSFASHDDALLGIRSKGEIIRPLKPVSAPVRDIAKLICILGVPLLVVVWGLARWRRRQSWRHTISSAFSPQAAPVA